MKPQMIAGMFLILLTMAISAISLHLVEAKPTPCPVCPQATSLPAKTPLPSATTYAPTPCPEIIVYDLPDMAQIEKDLALAYIELEKAYEYGHRLYTSVPGPFNSEVAVTVNCIGAAMERIEYVGKRLELWSALGAFEGRK